MPSAGGSGDRAIGRREGAGRRSISVSPESGSTAEFTLPGRVGGHGPARVAFSLMNMDERDSVPDFGVLPPYGRRRPENRSEVAENRSEVAVSRAARADDAEAVVPASQPWNTVKKALPRQKF